MFASPSVLSKMTDTEKVTWCAKSSRIPVSTNHSQYQNQFLLHDSLAVVKSFMIAFIDFKVGFLKENKNGENYAST